MFALMGLALGLGFFSTWSDLIVQKASAQSTREYLLDFGVTGRVSVIHIKEGDKVKKGQILAELEDAYFLAMIEAAQAKVDRTSAEFDEADNALQRSQVLYDEGSLSGVELERSKIHMLISQEAFLSAKALLLQAREKLALSKIIAPDDGMIEFVSIGYGENIVLEYRKQASISMTLSP